MTKTSARQTKSIKVTVTPSDIRNATNLSRQVDAVCTGSALDPVHMALSRVFETKTNTLNVFSDEEEAAVVVAPRKSSQPGYETDLPRQVVRMLNKYYATGDKSILTPITFTVRNVPAILLRKALR